MSTALPIFSRRLRDKSKTMPVLAKRPGQSRPTNITIVDLDVDQKRRIYDPSACAVLKDIDGAFARTGERVFLISPESELKRVSPMIRQLNTRNHLSGLLVRETSSMVTTILADANIHALKHLVTYSEVAVPQRIIKAWINGEQAETIAKATVLADDLVVLTCGFDVITVPLVNIPQLYSATGRQRQNFKISPAGVSIHWPEFDIHLDLEGVRTILDPDRAKAAEQDRLRSDTAYGRAIAILREQFKLRQEDVVGLSARHVRRIESGQSRASAKSIRELANAHGLDLNDYMDRLAQIVTCSR